MRYLPVFGLLSFVCALGSSAASCTTTEKFRSLCSDDAYCQKEYGNEFWVCDETVGDCACTGDDACGEREHCEKRPGGDGRCHPDVTCEWNGDCAGSSFCDRESGFCRATGCKSDLQCDLGEICDSELTERCLPGCRSHGDCVLGDACICGEDEHGEPRPCECDEENREGCQVGACISDICVDKSFCKYQDLCVDDPESEFKKCQIDERGPYCGNCILQPGGGNPCDPNGGPNFCLVDQTDAAGKASFCGVDCSEGQECPNGFRCSDVLVLTSATCTSSSQCTAHPNADTCDEDADCGPGGRCAGGKCAGTCRVSEGGQQGFCSCISDEECPQQACTAGRCDITRDLCVDDEDCRNQIFCVNNGTAGYCRIGQNCAPEVGITCNDVRCDQNPEGCE